MGKDNQPKERQAAQLARKAGKRASYDRVLIVCEGSKTEPHYLGEIRNEYRLQTTNVQVQHSQFGTSPIQVAEYAEDLFRKGDETKNIQPRAFEQVYVVFDRDDHVSYHNALAKVDALNNKLLNDVRQKVKFQTIASVPCFEIWLLLHFEDVSAPLHRAEVYRRLRQYLINYDKGQGGHYAQTCQYMAEATQRAERLSELTTAYDGAEPYTDMHHLVKLLVTLKS